MIEFLAQFDGRVYKPFTLDDVDKVKEHKPNQVVKIQAYGTDKERSYIQLQRYWVLCTKAAIVMSDHNNQLTREDIDFKLKARAMKKNPAFIKRFEVIGEKVVIEPISIAFRNMKHLIANKYFDIANNELEKLTGYTIEQLSEIN